MFFAFIEDMDDNLFQRILRDKNHILHALLPDWRHSLEQGWQVSAKGGLNRGLNRFKPVWQKQVSAIGFCHCM